MYRSVYVHIWIMRSTRAICVSWQQTFVVRKKGLVCVYFVLSRIL